MMNPEQSAHFAPDDIISEVRAIRKQLAAEHGYDVRQLFEAMKRREQVTTRVKLEPDPRPAEKNDAFMRGEGPRVKGDGAA